MAKALDVRPWELELGGREGAEALVYEAPMEEQCVLLGLVCADVCPS